MEPILMVVIILMIALLGLLVFNNKIGLSTINIVYIIIGITLGSMILLMLTYNAHSECDFMVNHNNVTIQALQEKCFQYIDI